MRPRHTPGSPRIHQDRLGNLKERLAPPRGADGASGHASSTQKLSKHSLLLFVHLIKLQNVSQPIQPVQKSTRSTFKLSFSLGHRSGKSHGMEKKAFRCVQVGAENATFARHMPVGAELGDAHCFTGEPHWSDGQRAFQLCCKPPTVASANQSICPGLYNDGEYHHSLRRR